MGSKSATRGIGSQKKIGSKDLKLPKLRTVSEEVVNIVEAERSLESDKSTDEELCRTDYRKQLYNTFFSTLMNDILSNRETLSVSQSAVEDTGSISCEYDPQIKSNLIPSIDGSNSAVEKSTNLTSSVPEMVPFQNRNLSSFERITNVQEVSHTTEVSVENETKTERIEFKNGNIYVGETLEDLMHGHGLRS
nr:uncharacterized protein LOC111502762 [Leptinotarsa decemlineata]